MYIDLFTYCLITWVFVIIDWPNYVYLVRNFIHIAYDYFKPIAARGYTGAYFQTIFI